MGDEEIKSITRLETQFENFSERFEEFKREHKENNQKVSDKIDELTKELNKFGGFFNALTAQQISINSLDSWRISVSPLIDSIGKTKLKITDIVWETIKVGVLFIVGYLSAKIFK